MRSPNGVLITGASGGIGAALAAAYAAPERTLWLQGRRAARLEEVAAECRRRGARVETKEIDLADADALLAWLAPLAERIDLAVVNAGITSDVRTGENWPEVDRVLQVNVRGAFATVAGVLPAMRRRGRGQIALVSSIAAWVGMPLTPAYCASKAALKAYGESLRGWLAPQGIEVSVVMPGFVRTGMSDRFPGPKRFMLEPEQAAARIVAGLERNQARIAFPFAPSFAMWALGALPAGLAQRLLSALGYAR